jgi:hypothetical protein
MDIEIKDHSDLKSDKRVRIPLNGETYYARAYVPAEVTLAAVGANSDPAAMSALVEAVEANREGKDVSQEVLIEAAKAGNTATNRAVMFMQAALEPESAARWAQAMASSGPECITLAQVMAVYRDLIAAYSSQDGGEPRPTTPRSSSSGGRGGRGRASTAGARRKG